MIVRKWYDLNGLSKETRIEILNQADILRDRIEFRRDLKGFEGSSKEAIFMIINAQHAVFYCFRETLGNVIEYEVGCRFSRKIGVDDNVINVRMNRTLGEMLIEQFDLKEWQP